MRTVVANMLVSADGVAQDPEEFVTEFDAAMEADLAEMIASQDAVVLGRRTYDEWSHHWPGSDDQPFAGFVNGVRKYVATSTPLAREWTSAQPIEGPAEDFVRGLKAGQGGDIGVHGSITLTRSLLAAGLVDELRLVVVPCVLGSGRRLFEEGVAVPLELVRSASTPSGSILVHYRVGGA